MEKIPEDVMEIANGCCTEIDVAYAILAERKRCADWCDKVAFLEWEQGELGAQRALNKARDNILSGDGA